MKQNNSKILMKKKKSKIEFKKNIYILDKYKQIEREYLQANIFSGLIHFKITKLN